jgi:hypothetical protein
VDNDHKYNLLKELEKMSPNEPTSTSEHRPHPEHDVTITVDGHPHKVRPGLWVVKDLKAAVGVDPAKVLAEITPQGLNDLADTATIEIKEGLRFMSHARSGGAS